MRVVCINARIYAWSLHALRQPARGQQVIQSRSASSCPSHPIRSTVNPFIFLHLSHPFTTLGAQTSTWFLWASKWKGARRAHAWSRNSMHVRCDFRSIKTQLVKCHCTFFHNFFILQQQTAYFERKLQKNISVWVVCWVYVDVMSTMVKRQLQLLLLLHLGISKKLTL